MTDKLRADGKLVFKAPIETPRISPNVQIVVTENGHIVETSVPRNNLAAVVQALAGRVDDFTEVPE